MDDKALIRQRVEASMQKYSKRHGKTRQKSRKNKTPEKDLVRELLNWLASRQFAVHVIESKAVFSQSAGRYLRGQTDPGMSDIIGVDNRGFGSFIEAKAPGRLKTIKPHQLDFLTKMAKQGAFACVTDSVDRLEHLYNTWRRLQLESTVSVATKFLLDAMP